MPWSHVIDRNNAGGRYAHAPPAQRAASRSRREADAPAAASASALDQSADGRQVAVADNEISFRKTEIGPGGSGVAEIALRFGRLLGMFARPFGVPWLLSEICARSLGYGCVSGVFHGP